MAAYSAPPRGTARAAALTCRAEPRLATRILPSVSGAPTKEAKSDSGLRPVGLMDETRRLFPPRQFPMAGRPTLHPSANSVPDTHNRKRDRFLDTGPVCGAGASDGADRGLTKTTELL